MAFSDRRNKIARTFNIGLLIYQRVLTGFIMLVFFKNVSLMEFLAFLDGRSYLDRASNASVPQGSIRGPTLFINNLPICVIAIYADDTTLYCAYAWPSICGIGLT